MDARSVARGLHLGDEYGPWLTELERVGPAPGPGPLELGPPAQSAQLLARFGCSPEAVADTLATLPDPARDPERCWLLERCRARLVRDIGDPAAERGSWPKLPPPLGLEGSCFHLHVFLATLPMSLAWHRARGVPEEVSWATFADLGRHVDIYRATTGMTGIDEPWWLTLHLRCILFQLGRLQYSAFRLGIGPEHPSPWYDDGAAALLGEGFRRGDAALGIHVPPGGTLAPSACDESLRQAAPFFGALIPVGTRRIATLSSWLLDDQLAQLLPDGSNILDFQRRFTLVPGWDDGDDGVMTFVFRSSSGSLDGLEARTTLQRSVLEHLRLGGHFRWRAGWCDLPRAR